MYKYKRENENLDEAKKIEYSLSDNSKVCFNTNGLLKTEKPYHGMFIKSGKVLLENIVDTFDVEDEEYVIVSLDTKEKTFETDKYIQDIDLEKNQFEYNIGNIEYTKRIAFKERDGILCIEYNVKNKERANAIFKVTPLITYRDLFTMKNESMLNFNQRVCNNGSIISLSVLNQDNLVLKSDKMKWIERKDSIQNVKHKCITKRSLSEEETFEDLHICGNFEIEVKGFSETKIYVYISYKDFEINDLNNLDIFNNIEKRNKNITFGIDENFIELIDLSKSMLNTDMADTLVATLPYLKEYNESYINTIKNLNEKELHRDLNELIDITRSIEGQLIYYKKVKEQKKAIQLIYKIIKEYGNLELKGDLRDKYNNLRLWYIESINRILQKETRIELYIDSIKEILFDLIEPDNRVTCFNNFETTALMLNAIKIYLNILSWIGDTDKQMEIQEEYFYETIKREFWIKEKNIMKRKRDEKESYVNVEMLYALSLSFPCVKDDIPNKVLDSVFRELYTPYGLRKISKHSQEYDNMVYPKYMAHFIKANLRLAGITRASQKISYNLVKELLQDVGKNINGGIKKVYNENGIQIDSMGYDTLTNAEMIRLYNMFM